MPVCCWHAHEHTHNGGRCVRIELNRDRGRLVTPKDGYVFAYKEAFVQEAGAELDNLQHTYLRVDYVYG